MTFLDYVSLIKKIESVQILTGNGYTASKSNTCDWSGWVISKDDKTIDSWACWDDVVKYLSETLPRKLEVDQHASDSVLYCSKRQMYPEEYMD